MGNSQDVLTPVICRVKHEMSTDAVDCGKSFAVSLFYKHTKEGVAQMKRRGSHSRAVSKTSDFLVFLSPSISAKNEQENVMSHRGFVRYTM